MHVGGEICFVVWVMSGRAPGHDGAKEGALSLNVLSAGPGAGNGTGILPRSQQLALGVLEARVPSAQVPSVPWSHWSPQGIHGSPPEIPGNPYMIDDR